MSEMYEGVVFPSDEASARAAFSTMTSPLRLRLVQLAEGAFGIYRVAGRNEPPDRRHIEELAIHLSAQAGRAAAFLYDNSCGVRVAVLYQNAERVQEFGADDERWAPLDESGEPIHEGSPLRSSELRPGEEYDCLRTAIDVGLEALQAGLGLNSELLKRAFCYEGLGFVAESS